MPPPKYANLQFPTLEGSCTRITLSFLNQSIQVNFDLAGVLVGVDFEVTKLAALATKWNMQIEAEWIHLCELVGLVLQLLRQRSPASIVKRRVVGNKIVTNLRSCLRRIRHEPLC